MLLEKKNAMCLVNKNDNVLRPSLSEKHVTVWQVASYPFHFIDKLISFLVQSVPLNLIVNLSDKNYQINRLLHKPN